jgi:hypothetical protein
MAPETTRPTDADDADRPETRPFPLRALLSPVTALAGVVLLVAAARVAPDDRRRAGLLAGAGAGLLAAWLRRQGPPSASDPAATGTAGDRASDADVPESSTPEVVADDDASDVVEADDDVPAPDVDETDDRM